MKTLRIIFTICFSAMAASLAAQSRHYNSASLGMGGGGTAYMDGYHANFLNPANLMLDDGRKPNNTVGIFGGLGVRFGGSFVNISVYNQYLTDGNLITSTNVGTENEAGLRYDMLNDWFGSSSANTRDMALSLDIVPIGFSHRGRKSAFSFVNRTRVIEDLSVNKGFMELAFYGLDPQKFNTAVPVNFQNTFLSYSEFSIGYARELPVAFTGLVEKLPFINGVKMYAGIAPKYIVGVQSFEMDFNSTLQISPVDGTSFGGITHDFDYSLYVYGEMSEQMSAYSQERAVNPDTTLGDFFDYSGGDTGTLGSGFGLDMGVTAELDVSLPALGFLGKRQVLRLAMSVTDIGSITFDNTPSRVSADGLLEYTGDIGDQTFEEYGEAFSDSLQNDIYGGFSSQETGGRKYQLPGMYNFGTALTLGKLTTTIDYGFGFNNQGTNSRRSVLTLGAEYRFLNFIPVRVGTRLGGYSSASYSAGFGFDLKYFEFTLAVSNVANSNNNGSSGTFAWSGLIFRF